MMANEGRRVGSNVYGIGARTNDSTRANEEKVRLRLEKAWACEIHPFGLYCAIDFYAIRNGELAALIEMKSRAAVRPMVFLNVRKWLALTLAQAGLGVPAFFVYLMGEEIRYVAVDDIDARRVRMGGQRRITDSHTDIEPVIEVQVDSMKVLKEAT